jgi:hypothetical protein
MHIYCMIDEIKTWLKSTGRTRDWLGMAVNVQKRTVDNWLSAGQTIPEAKMALIRRLMHDDEAAENARRQQLDPVAQVFSLEVSLPKFRRYNECALRKQKTLENWAIDELDKAAEEYFAAKPTTLEAPENKASRTK